MADHTQAADVGPPVGDPIGWDPDGGWTHPTLRRAVEHGVRLYNDRAYHPAHDCFEDEWFNYGQGRLESRFCHGMVQVAAGALKYAEAGDLAGMESLFGTASQYLRDVPRDFYGVDVLDVRTVLQNARTDPSVLDDWRITLDGSQPRADRADYAYAAALE